MCNQVSWKVWHGTYTEGCIGKDQCGSCEGKSTVQQTLRQVI